MKKCVLLLLALAPMPAAAQLGGGVVLCTNCSTFDTQLLQYALEIQQLAKDAEIAISAANILLNAVENTTGRQGSAYRDLTLDLQQLTNLAKQASLLDGFAGQMLQDLNTGFPEARLGEWPDQFAAEAAACSNAMTQAGQVLALQPTQLLNDAQGLTVLVAEILDADGRQQSLQTLGGITSSVGQLVQKLQGTLATAHQGQMTCQMANAHRQAVLDRMDGAMFDGAWGASCDGLRQVGGDAAECH